MTLLTINPEAWPVWIKIPLLIVVGYFGLWFTWEVLCNRYGNKK